MILQMLAWVCSTTPASLKTGITRSIISWCSGDIKRILPRGSNARFTTGKSHIAATQRHSYSPAWEELERKSLQQVDHLFLLAAGESIVEGQPEELVADTLGHRAITRFAAETLPHGREM